MVGMGTMGIGRMTSGETNGEMIPITIGIGRMRSISMSGSPARMTRAWKRIGHKQGCSLPRRSQLIQGLTGLSHLRLTQWQLVLMWWNHETLFQSFLSFVIAVTLSSSLFRARLVSPYEFYNLLRAGVTFDAVIYLLVKADPKKISVASPWAALFTTHRKGVLAAWSSSYAMSFRIWWLKCTGAGTVKWQEFAFQYIVSFRNM